MQTEAQVCPRLAIVANARSAPDDESAALLKAGLIKVAPDSWLSLTEKGRELLHRYGYKHSTRGWRPSGPSAQRPFHFIRTHKPSGSLYVADFNRTHSPYWGGDEWRFTPINTLEHIAAGLIDRWNSRHPENELWSYQLGLGPAPQANTSS